LEPNGGGIPPALNAILNADLIVVETSSIHESVAQPAGAGFASAQSQPGVKGICL
jgi:hypothetical protein